MNKPVELVGRWGSLAAVAYRATSRVTDDDTAAARADLHSWSAEQRRGAALGVHADATLSGAPTTIHGDALDLLDNGIEWTRADLVWSLGRLLRERGLADGEAFQLPARIAAALGPAELAGLVAPLRALVGDLLDGRFPAAVRRPLVALFGAAIDRATGDPVPTRLLHQGDDFGPGARAALAPVLAAPGVRDALVHAATLVDPKPSARWLTTAATVRPPAAEAIRALLARFAADPQDLHPDTDELLRGLTYLHCLDPSTSATELICEVARAAAAAPRWATGYPHAPRTAHAACRILSERDGDEPARTLARLSLTVRNKALATRVRAALDHLGARRGWQEGEVLELAVDDHGLDADGRRAWTHDGWTIVLELTTDGPRLRYEHAGEPRKTVPAAVRAAPAFREAKAEQKRLAATLAAERQRLEGLSAHDRVWPLAEWRSRYLDHAVTSAHAKRLVWEVSHDGARWTAGVPALDPGTFAGAAGVVRLWHPLSTDRAEVAAWRDRIAAGGVRQPFKQVYREAYVITPAEATAGDASARFATHILRYRQASALMRARGWEAPFLGGWSGGYQSEATKVFGGWRARLAHEIADLGEAGSPIEHCATGTVRFARREGRRWTAIPLTEVPPRVFSEAMRDVDLFVGVASIGTDDAWAERGEHRFFAYWRESGFGELSARAEVRRDALARMLPKLRIAGRCELGDRFLRVRGSLRTYRIHLGSGNVLMEPDDAYLCIVPGRAPARVALPFDDDPTLSVIISKALLLASDGTIKDATILSQIRR
ncbi:DUF4132 domain-containing protein [Asanoa sp. WMMD1127]|uniref:DUF4132 domain-containing protein n=1 Tax=Asanoa sp. WMMD1127 TaxID=3016107 RepID=UPI00241744A3|nr:DUF4132 domain-containing protein [Asanoa sp. WMMD1127]MDG4826312.1 DUF4132 domain-containing protein [Asanoa sp. WMMD1127]